MKIKVSFFNKEIRVKFLKILGCINLFTAFGLIVFTIPNQYKLLLGMIMLFIFILIYISIWLHANYLRNVKLHINNSTLRIKVGDIFETDGLKVIPFNEYYDTEVDDELISTKSLNGIYISKFIPNVSELNDKISMNPKLQENSCGTNENRKRGKKNQYKLGSIFKNDEYLLTAFSKFDKDNRAYLQINDYINCLINFWNEIDIINSGTTIVVPLMGSGITRFKEYNLISEQELLELLIWSFKVSRIKITHPSYICIVIDKSKKDKINFYRLRSVQNGL